MDFARVLGLVSTYLAALSAFFGGMWTVLQYVTTRAREAKAREFEVFHKLILELVQPEAPDAKKFLDRQIAVVFELRFFPRYYPVTRRILKGLKADWSKNPEFKRLVDEMDHTLAEIHRRENAWRCRFARCCKLAPPLD